MSEAARNIRSERKLWAKPGSSHDRVIALLRTILPMAIGVLAAFLVMAPLTRGTEVSFVLDKNKVELAPERLKIERARYSGSDDKGQAFELLAGSALQKSSAEPVVQLNDLAAQLQLPDGPARIRANRGRYDIKQSKVAIDGPIAFRAADGYALDTSNVTVDLKSRQLAGSGQVEGAIPLGTFRADKMTADLETRNLHLDGNVRLRITPKRPHKR